jgi:hypothetical protein
VALRDWGQSDTEGRWARGGRAVEGGGRMGGEENDVPVFSRNFSLFRSRDREKEGDAGEDEQ